MGEKKKRQEQGNLFYEDIYDALQKMVHGNAYGFSMKEIAARLWPAKKPETARSTLSRAITEEYSDINLDPQEVEKSMEITGRPEDIIYYFCDKFGFERPVRKTRDSLKQEVMSRFGDIQELMKDLNKKMDKLRDE
jgi:hypothetical protein